MARPKAENAAEQEKLMSKEEKSALAVWEEQPACPHCGQRPGYNPLTGITVTDGHRVSCLRPQVRK